MWEYIGDSLSSFLIIPTRYYTLKSLLSSLLVILRLVIVTTYFLYYSNFSELFSTFYFIFFIFVFAILALSALSSTSFHTLLDIFTFSVLQLIFLGLWCTNHSISKIILHFCPLLHWFPFFYIFYKTILL